MGWMVIVLGVGGGSCLGGEICVLLDDGCDSFQVHVLQQHRRHVRIALAHPVDLEVLVGSVHVLQRRAALLFTLARLHEPCG